MSKESPGSAKRCLAAIPAKGAHGVTQAVHSGVWPGGQDKVISQVTYDREASLAKIIGTEGPNYDLMSSLQPGSRSKISAIRDAVLATIERRQKLKGARRATRDKHSKEGLDALAAD